MATRYYLRDTTATGVVPNAKQSGDTILTELAAATASYASPALMSKVAGSGSFANEGNGANTADPHFTHYGSWASVPVCAMSLSGTVTIGLVMREENTKQNNYVKVYIYQWLANDTKGSDILTYTDTGTEIATAYPASPVTYISQTISSISLATGDRIVIEIESSDDPTETTVRQHGLRYGGADGGGYGSYVEFSANIGSVETITKPLQYYIRRTRTATTGGTGLDVYTTVGTTTWKKPKEVDIVEVLVVAGGGGGGCGAGGNGGGGGGGIVYHASKDVTGDVSVTVGAGGAGYHGPGAYLGDNGGDSIFDDITAIGGGGGGDGVGSSGGSGGGGGWVNNAGGSGTQGDSGGGTGYGHAGGSSYNINPNYGGGGGGGAGEVGHNADTSGHPGDGGIGLPFSITGASVYYGEGGGGGTLTYSSWISQGGSGNGGTGANTSQDAGNAVANTGSGGGGNCNNEPGNHAGDGSSGIVVVKYNPTPSHKLNFFIAGFPNTEIQQLPLVYSLAHLTTKSLQYCIYRTAQQVVSPGYTVVSYKDVGTTSFTPNVLPTSVDYLVVAGGGGGAWSGYTGYGDGGGGAGGLLTGTTIITGETTVVVGNGGAAEVNGGNSQFGTVIATGGGRGGDSWVNGGNGGSGGGAPGYHPTGHGTGIAGQGYDGGEGVYLDHGGGGGGAGEPGLPLTGGDGLQSDITGTLTWYAGGGGGSHGGAGGLGGGGAGGSAGVPPGSGVANTGGGGGGSTGTVYPSAPGGSGVVIVRYHGLICLQYYIAVPTKLTLSLGYAVCWNKSLTYAIKEPRIYLGLTYSIELTKIEIPLQFRITATRQLSPVAYSAATVTASKPHAEVPLNPILHFDVQCLIYIRDRIYTESNQHPYYKWYFALNPDTVPPLLPLPWWLQFGITSENGPVYVNQYTISTHALFSPKSWTLQGWTGSAWTTLSTVTNYTSWGSDQVAKTFTCTGTTAYEYFKLNVTAVTGTDLLFYSADTLGGFQLGNTNVKLKYVILKKGAVLHYDLNYWIRNTKTKSLQYTIPSTSRVDLGLGYHLCHLLPLRSLTYYVRTSSKVQRNLQYCVLSVDHKLTKSLSYEIIYNRSTVNKYLTYVVTPLPPSQYLDKWLTYDILGAGGVHSLKVTTHLEYEVTLHPTRQAELRYYVKRSNVLTKLIVSLVYDIRNRKSTKSLQYSILYVSIGTKKTTRPLTYAIKLRKFTCSLQYVITKLTKDPSTKSLSYQVLRATAVVDTDVTNLSMNRFGTGVIATLEATVSGTVYTTPTWYWEFGDGTGSDDTASYESIMYHEYNVAGTYSATAHAYFGEAERSAATTFTITQDQVETISVWFFASPYNGSFPLTVHFYDCSYVSGFGGAKAWLWYFGDNTTSTEQNPVHTYASSGVYDVTLWIYGTYQSKSLTQFALIGNTDPPVADFEIVSGGLGDAGTFLVTLTVTDDQGRSTFTSKYVQPTSATFTHFKDKSTGNIVDWLWDYGHQVEPDPNE